jgi:glycosyltransferase involved in cell wall biosynthesis
MWNGKRVSVVLATYREKDSIRSSIEEFLATGVVDEIVVVNNNAEAGTDEEIRKTPAHLVYETRQGYGYAFRKGIREATGDYIVLCEPDHTFLGADIHRFLVYSRDFQAVLGSRTNRSTIARDTAMTPLRRLGNVVYAKMIEILFGALTITDIGCSYKLFHKSALRLIEPHFRTGSPLFATELVLLIVSHRIPFVEIPVSYRKRTGHSTIISHWHSWFTWGLAVLAYIWYYWYRWVLERAGSSIKSLVGIRAR